MMQNDYLRNRLKNYLDVHLTDSNVVQIQPQLISASRINTNLINQNSDMSIINQLDLLDQTVSNYEDNIFVSRFATTNTKQDNLSTYIKKYPLQSANSPLVHKNKIIQYRQQFCSKVHQNQNTVKTKQNYQNQYKNRDIALNKDRENVINSKQYHIKQFTNHKNELKVQRKSYPTQQNNFKLQQNHIADIQQKISILPFQLQQKIKENLQRKIVYNNSNSNQFEQISPIKKGPQFQNKIYQNKSITPNQLQRQNLHFIIPYDQRDTQKHNNFYNQNKQKFISLNRETLSKNKSVNKSIIINQMQQLKQKNSTPHLKLNTKRQSQFSRQKNLLRNTQNNAKNEYFFIRNNDQRSNQRQQFLRNKETSKQKHMLKSVEINKQNSQKIPQYTKKLKYEQNKGSEFEDLDHFINKKQLKNKNKSINTNHNHQFIDKHDPTSKQILFQVSDQFNKSKIIKNYSQILKLIPKCKKCNSSYGALTLSHEKVIFSCNQCDLKEGLQRSVSFRSSQLSNSQNQLMRLSLLKDSQSHNHPIIGVLFDIQNKLLNQTEMKTYNMLLKQVSSQLQRIQETKFKLMKLQSQIQILKNKLKHNSKLIFDSKNCLKKFISNDMMPSLQNQHTKLPNFKALNQIIPSQYLKELDLWCKIKSQNFTQWPQIDKKLQMLCPLFLKKNINTIKQFLDPLLHNFQNNDVKISVSQGLKLPVNSLGSATFLIDGSYNISNFDKVQKLTLEFINKRTFRQITSMMQNLPLVIDQVRLNYNHKLNSHISAQKYPILTKLCSIRTCKRLYVKIENCKDQDDLLTAFKVMTKKKQLEIVATRSIYVRKEFIEATIQIIEMIRRLGKNIVSVKLSLFVNCNQEEIYKELILNQRNKLLKFEISSLLNAQDESKSPFIENFNSKKQKDNILNVNQILNQINQDNQQQNKRNDQKSAKKAFSKICFQNKIRKKLQALAILKESFSQKYIISKTQSKDQYQRAQSNKDSNLLERIKQKQQLRFQVLKMLL